MWGLNLLLKVSNKCMYSLERKEQGTGACDEDDCQIKDTGVGSCHQEAITEEFVPAGKDLPLAGHSGIWGHFQAATETVHGVESGARLRFNGLRLCWVASMKGGLSDTHSQCSMENCSFTRGCLCRGLDCNKHIVAYQHNLFVGSGCPLSRLLRGLCISMEQ